MSLMVSGMLWVPLYKLGCISSVVCVQLLMVFCVFIAECCLSLRELIGKSPVSVRRELTHQALPVGELE